MPCGALWQLTYRIKCHLQPEANGLFCLHIWVNLGLKQFLTAVKPRCYMIGTVLGSIRSDGLGPVTLMRLLVLPVQMSCTEEKQPPGFDSDGLNPMYSVHPN